MREREEQKEEGKNRKNKSTTKGEKQKNKELMWPMDTHKLLKMQK
jgi:hypothetical protein